MPEPFSETPLQAGVGSHKMNVIIPHPTNMANVRVVNVLRGYNF